MKTAQAIDQGDGMFLKVNGGYHYRLVRLLIQRGLGVLYFVAFLIIYFQWAPLLGEQGLLPVPIFVKFARFWDYPSLFIFFYTDSFAKALSICGLALSLLAFSGFSEKWGRLVSLFVWLILWLLYLSFVNVGQLFYSYGWEILLLEAGFLAIFLGSDRDESTGVMILLFRWLLFRVMFGAGLIKIRGDECWRVLSCMQYHYETQPLPNPLSWYFHHTPQWFHTLEVLVTHVVELVLPFFYFGWRRMRIIAGLSAMGFQLLLIASGNLSWLNYITLVIAWGCLDDEFLTSLFRFARRRVDQLNQQVVKSLIHRRVNQGLFILILGLSIAPVMNLVSSHQMMNASFDSVHLVNTYGAFGSVSKERDEVIFFGTLDQDVDSHTHWLEYEFKGKPGSVERGSPVVSPYHWKLDWQMWFAAMATPQEYPWIFHFVLHLLRGDPQTLSLIDQDPLRGLAPRWIKADLYRYEFTSWEEREKSGRVWKRAKIGQYLSPLSLQSPELRRFAVDQGWLE